MSYNKSYGQEKSIRGMPTGNTSMRAVKGVNPMPKTKSGPSKSSAALSGVEKGIMNAGKSGKQSMKLKGSY